MAKAFCPECGNPVQLGDRYCAACGGKLPPEIAGQAAPAATLPAGVAEVRETDLLPEFSSPRALLSNKPPAKPVVRPAHPDPSLSYFEDEKPRGSALCSDNACPCPETSIPKGTGYLYIPRDIVEFRRGYPRMKDAQQAKETQLNQQLDRKGIGAAFVSVRIGPILVCEQGARLRELDLEIAGADARYWWETGQVPLRPTPLVGGKQQSGDGDDTWAVGMTKAQQPSNCFIATAACGTDQAEDVVRLREFRERVLRPTTLGRTFIVGYECCSPPLARLIGRWRVTRLLTRKAIVMPLSCLAKRILNRTKE